MATYASNEPVPPYVLEPLLYPALPQDDPATSPDPNSPAGIKRAQNKALRCVEGDADHLYVGSSDGTLHIYSVISPSSQSSSSQSRSRYRLQSSKIISNNAKPVERIVILSSLSVAAVLCEGVLSFFTLPDWTPARNLPSIRAVSTLALDDEELEHSRGQDGAGMVSLCIVRRKNILLVKVRQDGNGELACVVNKDIPLPGGATTAKRYGDTLCIANISEYSLVNLSTGEANPLHLPITQTGETPSAQVRPSIVSIPGQRPSPSLDPRRGSSSTIPPKCEFLLTSHTGSVTLGVFVTPSGEPSPKLLEWPSHPRSLVYTSSYLFSLLRNDTIEVHNIRSDVMEKVETQHLPPGSEPRFLSSTPKTSQMKANANASSSHFENLDIIKVDLQTPSSSKLLRRHPSSIEDDGQQSPTKDPLVLMCGRNNVQSLSQEASIDWGTDLFHKGHLPTLEAGLEALRQRPNLDDGTADELDLLHQALGIEYLLRARFWDAGEAFSKGATDPRLVMALFDEDVTGRLTTKGTHEASERRKKEAIVPAALTAYLGKMQDNDGAIKTIDDLIHSNLELNYSPPLDVASDPDLQELTQTLRRRAFGMLLEALKRWRRLSLARREGKEQLQRWAGDPMDDQMKEGVDRQVDTALLRLLAGRANKDEEAGKELDNLLNSKNACKAEDVEKVLKEWQYLGMLAKTYEKEKRWDHVLDIWTGLIDGRLTDKASRDAPAAATISAVEGLLYKLDDPALLSKYGTWLVKKDTDAGVRILTKKTQISSVNGDGSSKSTKEQELAALEGQRSTLDELSTINTKAAEDFLENAVLSTTKIQDGKMHAQLLDVLLTRVGDHIKEVGNRARLQAVASDYSSGAFAESFFAHLALAAMEAPDDVERLKLAMFLQGSTVLNLDQVLAKVERNDLLVYEKAIVLGKLGRDKEALQILALELRDANSAEAYCSQDGEVLSPMLSSSIAEDHPFLKGYSAMVSRTHKLRVKAFSKQGAATHARRQERKESLLRTLLSVYMEHGGDKNFRIATAHFLNTQALHLDPMDILKLVPDEWPLSTLETFLSQSLRRQMHRRSEVRITKAVSLCRNLDVAEDVWARLRAMGGVIQDTDDGGRDNAAAEEEQVGEKVVIPHQSSIDDGVHEIMLDKEAVLTNETADIGEDLT